MKSIQILLICLICNIHNLYAGSEIDSQLLTEARSKIFNSITTKQIIEKINDGLWNFNHTAVSIAFQYREKKSLLYIFFKNKSGQYYGVDISSVESGNLGKISISKRSDYTKIESIPIEWINRKDNNIQVVIRTRAWKKGQIYTVNEPLIINNDGIPLYR